MRNILFFINFLFLFVLQVSTLVAQTHNFSNYNVAEGLEQSDIFSISQASNGYLLYGSNGGGLGIYDGYSFKSIKEKGGLTNNKVLALAVDKDKNVWTATKGGISLLDDKVSYVKKNYLTSMQFQCIGVDTVNGEVFFGSKNGLYKYNNDLDSVEYFKTENEVLNNATIHCIYRGRKGELLIGTQSDGFFLMSSKKNVKQFNTQNGLASNYVKTIISGKGDDFLIGTVNGMCLLRNDSITIINLPKIAGSYLTFTCSAKHKDKLVFGALNNQLYFIDPSDNYSAKWLTFENGFIYKKIWAVFSDKENNLWLGALGEGLVKYNPIFTFYNKGNKLISNNIKSIYKDAKSLYVGSEEGLNVIRNDSCWSYRLAELGFSRVNNINKFKKEIILGTNSGVYFFKNGKTERLSSKGLDLKNENVLTTCVDGKKIYIGGYSGLHLYQNDSISKISSIPSVQINDIIKYKSNIYIAVEKGVYLYSKGEVTFLSSEDGLVCNSARSFRVDNKNNLWIGTSEGAYLYNGKNFKNINEEDGLTSENIYFMETDLNGNIWLGSNKGIDRISFESIYQHWNDKVNKIDVRNYGKNEGFNGVECNQNTVFSFGDELLFGTINGLYTYHLSNDNVNEVPPIVILNNIKLNFENVKWKEYSDSLKANSNIPLNLELKYSDNNLIFEYVGVSLTNPREVHYQYMLEGLDENWLPITKDRKAVYTAIPHGDYVFKLKAKNSDGIWIDGETTFTFKIRPPWWKTTWFYVTSIITILLLGYIIIVVRTRNLKKTQIILTNKVEERTKELREEKEKVESVNTELAYQKKEVEVANKNITDSINYAKKIQDAILPKAAKLEELKESVSVLYMPKDVVSGDFYWYERVNNKLIFAAADCTGHGVPGAFMSMIGVNNLNQIIIENKITSPDRILQELNIAIKKVLKQEDVDSESRDGMDISICCFDLDERVIEYAGAFRPLIYIRDNELFELKGSRQPIGGSAPIDFNYDLNKFEIKKDDVFYMFSDGYPDQFGGPKGKKYMNKRLKAVFMDIYNKAPGVQRETLREELIKWMGNNEQIDDILVMCIKI